VPALARLCFFNTPTVPHIHCDSLSHIQSHKHSTLPCLLSALDITSDLTFERVQTISRLATRDLNRYHDHPKKVLHATDLMTSISQQPVLPPQAPSNVTQTVNQAHSPSASISGTTSPLGAAPVPATARSYASATKKPFSPSTSDVTTPLVAVGGQQTQHGKSDSIALVNGKNAIPPPAVPAVGGVSTIVNGNAVVTNSSGLADHSRKPSVTISAAGASGYMPNGGPVAGKPTGSNGIQFGSMGGSPAVANSVPQLPQAMSSSLAVAAPTNPRITSPQTSPSPIPQPAASGGRPPSSLQGQGNGLSFGSLGGEDGNVSSTSDHQLGTSSESSS